MDNTEELTRINALLKLKGENIDNLNPLPTIAELEADLPPELLALLEVPGVTPETTYILYTRLGICGAAELEEALKAGLVAELPEIGTEGATGLLQALEKGRGTVSLGTALSFLQDFADRLRQNDPTILRIEPTGPLRRGEESMEQINIIATSNDIFDTLELFLKLPDIAEVRRRWDYKADVVLKNGIRLEFTTCFPEQLATAWALTTGTREHRTQLRDLAYKAGYELSLGGFLRKEEVWPAVDEEEVFRYLGLPYIPPELRNGNGEIEAIKKGEMALDLVALSEIKGDLHTRSNWTNGAASIEELAHAAIALGYQYMVVADPVGDFGPIKGLTIEKLDEQRAEIYRVNEQLAQQRQNFVVLQGAEVEILPEGDLNLADSALAGLDLVIGAMWRELGQERRKITDRLLKAMNNPHVDVIAHPTGRILQRRPANELHMLKVFVASRETGTALELNASPDRLDLKSEHVQQALDEKAKLIIGTGAAYPAALGFMEYGVITARHAGARTTEVLNTLPWLELKKNLK